MQLHSFNRYARGKKHVLPSSFYLWRVKHTLTGFRTDSAKIQTEFSPLFFWWNKFWSPSASIFFYLSFFLALLISVFFILFCFCGVVSLFLWYVACVFGFLSVNQIQIIWRQHLDNILSLSQHLEKMIRTFFSEIEWRLTEQIIIWLFWYFWLIRSLLIMKIISAGSGRSLDLSCS